jgi:hypothetical protein
MTAIDFRQHAKGIAFSHRVDPGFREQVPDGLVTGAEERALVLGREESAAPVACAVVGQAAGTRKVTRGAPKLQACAHDAATNAGVSTSVTVWK